MTEEGRAPPWETAAEPMKIADYLAPSRILVPLEAEDLGGALRALLGTADPEASPGGGALDKLARDLAFGSVGEVIRLTSDAVAILAPREDAENTQAFLGLAPRPLVVTGEGRGEPGEARIVFLFLTGRRLPTLRGQAAPALSRWLKESPNRRGLLNAGTPAAVMEVEGFADLRLEDRLRVDAALQPVTYRVYPDTPLAEVVDLMVRRELHAVPVVGQGYEVMGIVTAGDALRHLVPRRRGVEGDREGDEAGGLTARDVMTRAVMCVAEEQPLLEAATLMVNRDVEQLPVVREGELVGFLTRDAVLRVLFGR